MPIVALNDVLHGGFRVGEERIWLAGCTFWFGGSVEGEVLVLYSINLKSCAFKNSLKLDS